MSKMTEIRNSYVEIIRNSEKTQNRHIQVPQNHGKTELEIRNYAGCLDVCHPIAPVLQESGSFRHSKMELVLWDVYP